MTKEGVGAKERGGGEARVPKKSGRQAGANWLQFTIEELFGRIKGECHQ